MMLDDRFVLVVRRCAEDDVIKREPARAADENHAEQEKHERRKLERLAERKEAVLAVHDKNRPGEDGDLHERNQAREQAEGEQRAADEMGQGDVVQQGRRNEPRFIRARKQVHEEVRANVADKQKAAGKEAEAEVDADAVEPEFAARFRPRHEIVELLHNRLLIRVDAGGRRVRPVTTN